MLGSTRCDSINRRNKRTVAPARARTHVHVYICTHDFPNLHKKLAAHNMAGIPNAFLSAHLLAARYDRRVEATKRGRRATALPLTDRLAFLRAEREDPAVIPHLRMPQSQAHARAASMNSIEMHTDTRKTVQTPLHSDETRCRKCGKSLRRSCRRKRMRASRANLTSHSTPRQTHATLHAGTTRQVHSADMACSAPASRYSTCEGQGQSLTAA